MAVLLLLMVIGVVPVVAAPDWRVATSPNFRIYSTASARDARGVIEYFEQVRDFFSRVSSNQMTTRLPVTIVVFRNDKEYKPYAPNATSAAYFIGDDSRDFIVMSSVGENHRAIAVHEYMHLLIRHARLDLPVWLNEGIAEVYSTMRLHGGKVAVGFVPKGRGWSLATGSWLKLPHLFSITHQSPEYNERERAGVLYAQSWLLTHMMMLHEGYRDGFNKFVSAVASGTTSADALMSIWGKSLADVERDMQGYYRSQSLQGMLFDTKLEKLKVDDPQAADAFDVDLTLARLTALLDRREEAEAKLLRLAGDHSDRWEAFEALGHLSWRKGELGRAREHFRKAMALDPPGWSVYWDFARVSGGEEVERLAVIGALRRVLERNAGHLEARIYLGDQLLRAKHFGDALATFNQIKAIDPDRAGRLFLGKAHALLQLENYREARIQAEQALKHAKESDERDSAQKILTYLDRREEYERQARMAVTRPPVDAPRTPSLPPAGVTGSTEEEFLPSIRAVLMGVDCLGDKARLRLQAGQRQIGFLVANPDKVIIRDSPGSSVELTCGTQPPGTRVLIEYVEKQDEETDTLGEVRTIEFLK